MHNKVEEHHAHTSQIVQPRVELVELRSGVRTRAQYERAEGRLREPHRLHEERAQQRAGPEIQHHIRPGLRYHPVAPQRREDQ